MEVVRRIKWERKRVKTVKKERSFFDDMETAKRALMVIGLVFLGITIGFLMWIF